MDGCCATGRIGYTKKGPQPRPRKGQMGSGAQPQADACRQIEASALTESLLPFKETDRASVAWEYAAQPAREIIRTIIRRVRERLLRLCVWTVYGARTCVQGVREKK